MLLWRICDDSYFIFSSIMKHSIGVHKFQLAEDSLQAYLILSFCEHLKCRFPSHVFPDEHRSSDNLHPSLIFCVCRCVIRALLITAGLLRLIQNHFSHFSLIITNNKFITIITYIFVNCCFILSEVCLYGSSNLNLH